MGEKTVINLSGNSSIGRALRLGRRSCEFKSRFPDSKEEFFDLKTINNMITQILFFVGGVLLSGLIGLVVWMVSVNKKINNLQSEVDDQNNVIDEIFDQLNERDRDKNEQLDQINRRVDTDIENIYRELDSKLDKLEYRLTKQASTNQ